MRQSDMINSIVQTEHHAQEITAEAERTRKNLDADVAAEGEKLKEQYRQEAQRRIAEAERLLGHRFRAAVQETPATAETACGEKPGVSGRNNE